MSVKNGNNKSVEKREGKRATSLPPSLSVSFAQSKAKPKKNYSRGSKIGRGRTSRSRRRRSRAEGEEEEAAQSPLIVASFVVVAASQKKREKE